ncbi:MAG: penicillin-binding protein 2 [Bacilli bacterium]|nr:penicillin-binding protein 2 [Bacilli bacterium]MDD4608225.1 penicillin-binding protein 2 [Bacilli bacterium]
MKKKKNIKTYNTKYSYYKQYKDKREVIEKRYNVIISVIIVIMIILLINLFNIQVINKNVYITKLAQLNQNITYGETAPRGRIYDRNGRLIVDNQAIKVIYYKKEKDVTTKEEVELAYKLADMIELDFSRLNVLNLKNFWLINNEELGKKKITSDEWQRYEERKLTSDQIQKMKLDRITEEELNEYNDLDRETAYIYYLMNKGYSYDEKIIKKGNISDEEYAKTSENIDVLKGFNTRLDWERKYLYGDVFRTILGSVSSTETGIPYELKDHYLSKGYSLNDQVGISYLEYTYDDYLKGIKNKYEVLKDGTYRLLEDGKRGNDIVLTIDIELQEAIEKIIVSQLLSAKKEPNTEYYNRSFVIISNPKTGEILAMAGKQIVKKDKGYEIYDYTPGVMTSPVAAGSVIKGASHIVGYNTGALKIGEVRDDACIKIQNTPIKCSWMYLGGINDVTALTQSSNTYQFHTAIKVGKGYYQYNKPLVINSDAFKIYRDTFAEFGLGIKTGIDLPVESLGYKGSNTLPGYLLDFSIGQYDTYTPIQLSQYIGTIANNGYRMKPYLLKSVYAPSDGVLDNILHESKPVVLNKVNTKNEYLKRVQLGFKTVLEPYGTGYYYIDPAFKPAGKTGTSESFIDTNNDGLIDTETITHNFVAYAPYNNPSITFTIISPDISHRNNGSHYQSNVNSRLAYQVSKKYFQFYK